MRYTEFIEDIGDIAAGGVGKLAGAIADLPGVLKDAYKDAKARIMKGANRRKFYDWYNTNWKGTDKYKRKSANNFADSIYAFAQEQGASEDTLSTIQKKYNAEAMVTVSADGKMLTKNNVVDQLFLDLAELGAERAVKRTAKAKNIKDFGKYTKPKEPDATTKAEPKDEPKTSSLIDPTTGKRLKY